MKDAKCTCTGRTNDLPGTCIKRWKCLYRKRLPSSIALLWRDSIQKEVTFFCGAYKGATYKQQSGLNADDYVKKALALYQVRRGFPFKFFHCWMILKDKPKWLDAMTPTGPDGTHVVKRKAKGAPLAMESTVVDMGKLAATDVPISSVRPMGNKMAKRAVQGIRITLVLIG